MKKFISGISFSFFPLIGMSVPEYVTQREQGLKRRLSLSSIIALQAQQADFKKTTLQGHDEALTSVVFSPDGSTLASGSCDKTIKLWDARSQKCTASLCGHDEALTSVVFSPDGSTLASGSRDKTIKLWDTRSQKCTASLCDHDDELSSVVFSPDGSTLASGSCDKTIKLWDARSQKCITTLHGHSDIISSVAFSPSGASLASGSFNDATIKFWNIRSQKCIAGFRCPGFPVTSVAFSPVVDSKFAFGSACGTILLSAGLRFNKWATLQQYTPYPVLSIAFSSDGSTLASGSADKVVKLWDVQSQNCITTLHGHSDIISSVAFSPDGSTLASGSYDKTIKLWRLIPS